MTIAFPIDRIQPATTEYEPAKVLSFPGAYDDFGALYGQLCIDLLNLASSPRRVLMPDVVAAVREVICPRPGAA